MPDREKVISELQSALGWCEPEDNPNGSVAVKLWAVKGAVELLKAVEPHYTILRYLVNGMEVAIHHPECPRCMKNGLFLWDAEIKEGQAYCKRCGQAVKWNET